MESMTTQQAVQTMHRISDQLRAAELSPPAQRSAHLDDLVEIVSLALPAGSEEAEGALDELVRVLNAHSNVTWYFARWWDVQTGPVDGKFGAVSTRRWLDLMTAYRAAMEV